MIVVLEGPDLSGKSTVAAELCSRYGGRVVSNGPPPAEGALVDHYLAQIDQASSRERALTVFDRLHVGELIYGPLFRGHVKLKDAHVATIERALSLAGAIRLHVDADDTTLLSRLARRGDALIADGKQLVSIAAQYRDLMRSYRRFEHWSTIRSADVPAYVQSVLGDR